MTTPEPPSDGDAPRGQGSHRAAPPSRSRSLLLAVLGVLAVLAALSLAGYMLMTSDRDDASDAGAGPTDVSPQPSDTQPSSTQQPTSEPTDSNSATSSAEPTGGSTKPPTKKPTDAPIPQIPVYVFNQTTITGLAQQLASQLEAAGWNVAGYDNWRGLVPEDTVYYYPGGKGAAQRLSADFPGIDRVWPASAPMPGGALTVILANTVVK